jgi:S-adenosylmethionine:tRNA ribosyltransferase-isomerase
MEARPGQAFEALTDVVLGIAAERAMESILQLAFVARGVAIAPIVLHTGVSSLELGERPYPEWYRVPASTARLVNATRRWGGRVIAVGTTVVRALESTLEADGNVAAREGWTQLVITPEARVQAVEGLITGWHDPDASHLDTLEAIGGPDLMRVPTVSPHSGATCGTSSATSR